MFSAWPKRIKLLHAALLCFLLPAAVAFAQQPTPTTPEQPEDVLRISTDLVQTDVMVFDKAGRFVDNLQRDQFELRVDGKPQPISFFDRVTAGSVNEDAQLAAARGVAPTTPAKEAPVTLLDRGRTIIFFVDDLHMASDSVTRTRKTLLNFIDAEMKQNDQVAIVSASGQIGFLEQFTDNKAVLRAAVERISYRQTSARDNERPPMSEFQALEIIERGNLEVLDFFIEQLARDFAGAPVSRAQLEQLVKNRATRMVEQSAALTRNTLGALESLTRVAGQLPGRKLLFFLSDGLFLTTQTSNVPELLRRITDAAARTGVVVYSIDARGLVTGMPDASVQLPADPTGRLARSSLGEVSASQELLRTLAADTGGRPLLNSNSLNAGIKRTLEETSAYYVLAWRPEGEGKSSGGKFRKLEVSIKAHPELTVRARRGFFDQRPQATAAKDRAPATPAPAKAPSATPGIGELTNAIKAVFPKSELPTALALDYQDSPQNGIALTIAVQVSTDTLEFETADGKEQAGLDVGGFVYNDQGQPGATFEKHITVPAESLKSLPQNLRVAFYATQVRLGPGLYQVRVAARDSKSKRIGSARQWIEIPDLKKGQLAMSTLFLGEVTAANAAETAGTKADASKAVLNILHRFARTSRLRFVTFIYNGTRGAAGTASPDVAIQIQLIRDNQPVLTTALRKVSTEGIADLARIPYAAEIPLDNLHAGRYLLKTTVIDRIAKTSATQQVSFEIE